MSLNSGGGNSAALAQSVAAIGADVDAGGDGCAGADDDEVPVARTARLVAGVPGLSFHCQAASTARLEKLLLSLALMN